MFSKKRDDEDAVTHSTQRTRVFMAAIDAIAFAEGIDFVDLSFEQKKAWLNDRMKDVIERAIAVGGPAYVALRKFHIFVVENDGNAVLYFEKIK